MTVRCKEGAANERRLTCLAVDGIAILQQSNGLKSCRTGNRIGCECMAKDDVGGLLLGQDMGGQRVAAAVVKHGALNGWTRHITRPCGSCFDRTSRCAGGG